MAFVFRAEKKDFTQTNKEKAPGPGTYVSHQPYQFEERKVPFASTADKQELRPKPDEVPGPGAYNIAKGLLAPEKTANVFFVPVNPDGDAEPSRGTNNFKSKAKRFENKADNEVPGPGTYNNRVSSLGRKEINPALTQKSKRVEQVQELLKQGKSGVPSIPSNLHSYGYTENDEHELVLNKNPLLQVQQFVGPGYYESTKNAAIQNEKYKGPAWHKSNVKKNATFAQGTATTQSVGPGTYDPEVASYNPAYKSNPHSGFISTSTRSFDMHVKQKLLGLGTNKFMSRTPVSSQSTMGERRGISNVETDADDDDEYMKDATPGPGYYHNDTLTSSFSLKTPNSDMSFNGRFTRSSKAPAFGGSVRFKDPTTTTKDIGPGNYDSNPKTKKLDVKYAKVPFLSSNIRFEREYIASNPGPGTYDPPVNIVHRVQEKGKSGYAGSFGVTDKRFKVSKLLEDLPGPGTYIGDDSKGKVDGAAIFKKGSHFFASDTTRGVFNGKSNNSVGPGAYDLTVNTIAKKTAKEEDDVDLPKRYPFNTGQVRFEKPKEKPIPEDEDEDEDDEPRFGTSKNLESLLKSKIKQKPHASFVSKTGRTIDGTRPKQNPGPGAYHDQNQNLWNKRTFNIHFTGD